MILLLLGWNLTLAGIVLIIFSIVTTGDVFSVCGIAFLIMGLIPSILLRKTCSSYKSDPIDGTKKEKPMDYYV